MSNKQQALQFEEALLTFHQMLTQDQSPLFSESPEEHQLLHSHLGPHAFRFKDRLSKKAMQRRMISPESLNEDLYSTVAYQQVELKRISSRFPELQYNCLPSPLGNVFLVMHEERLCYLNFLKYQSETEHLMICRKRWPKATFISNTKIGHHFAQQLGEVHISEHTPLSLINITDFQWRVYGSLLTVSYGQSTSYERLAFAAQATAASRAVGSAMASNPILWFLPCHRVLRQDGSIGRFSGGPGMKEALLLREAT